jgi:hypothetical protein
MLRNLLSRLGIGTYLPHSTAPGSEDAFAPQTTGDLKTTFVPGQKHVSADQEADPAAQPDQQTQDQLVWPGKQESFVLRNPEPVPYRYLLTAPNLDPDLYIRHPAQGGQWQPDGSVTLQPGEEATFSLSFVTPVDNAQKRETPFECVFTRFDPRRALEPGVVVKEVSLRWAPLPGSDTFRLRLRPAEILTRPWRRTALLEITLENKSALPPRLSLQIQRAPNAEALEAQPESAGQIRQAVPARVGGTWHAVLAPAAKPGSYIVAVSGIAQVAERAETPLKSNTVRVLYIPWLRRGRDWAALGGGVCGLIWLAWGLPVSQSPVVRLSPQFPAGIPAGCSVKDLRFKLLPADDPVNPVEGEVEGDWVVFRSPGRWYGYRWPFGWNRASQAESAFKVTAEVRDTEKEGAWGHYYKLGEWRSAEGDTQFTLPAKTRPVLGAWRVEVRAVAQVQKTVRARLRVRGLEALGTRPQKVTLVLQLNGTTVSQPVVLLAQGGGPLTGEVDLPVRPGETTFVLTVRATASPGEVWVEQNVSFGRDAKSVEMDLVFTKQAASHSTPPPGQPKPEAPAEKGKKATSAGGKGRPAPLKPTQNAAKKGPFWDDFNSKNEDPEKLALSMAPGQATVRLGENLAFTVRAGIRGYLIVLEEGPGEKLNLLFPKNPQADAAQVEPGRTVNIPEPGKVFAPDTRGPEHIKAFLFASQERAAKMLVPFQAERDILDQVYRGLQRVESQQTLFYTAEVRFEVR